ncbi:MAG: hypothetical protein KJ949_01775 [Nanoarchaeota archaeon]|nr:hypothetical protein [Nanoarchaeota archaeon]
MKYKNLTVQENCEHNLVVYLGIQKWLNKESTLQGRCLECKTGIVVKENYRKLNLYWDFWNSGKPIYAKGK